MGNHRVGISQKGKLTEGNSLFLFGIGEEWDAVVDDINKFNHLKQTTNHRRPRVGMTNNNNNNSINNSINSNKNSSSISYNTATKRIAFSGYFQNAMKNNRNDVIVKCLHKDATEREYADLACELKLLIHIGRCLYALYLI